MLRPRVLVIVHQEDCGPALWADLLSSAADPTMLWLHRGDPVPSTAEGYDGLLVLGGFA